MSELLLYALAALMLPLSVFVAVGYVSRTLDRDLEETRRERLRHSAKAG